MNIKKIQKNTKSFTESSIKKLNNEKNVLPQIIQDEYNLNGKAKSSWIYPDTNGMYKFPFGNLYYYVRKPGNNDVKEINTNNAKKDSVNHSNFPRDIFRI